MAATPDNNPYKPEVGDNVLALVGTDPNPKVAKVTFVSKQGPALVVQTDSGAVGSRLPDKVEFINRPSALKTDQ